MRLEPQKAAWENRQHFFGAVSQAMRRILVDHSRRRLADACRLRPSTSRVFAGMSIDQTAEAFELSPATVKRDWVFARAWLAEHMGHSG